MGLGRKSADDTFSSYVNTSGESLRGSARTGLGPYNKRFNYDKGDAYSDRTQPRKGKYPVASPAAAEAWTRFWCRGRISIGDPVRLLASWHFSSLSGGPHRGDGNARERNMQLSSKHKQFRRELARKVLHCESAER